MNIVGEENFFSESWKKIIGLVGSISRSEVAKKAVEGAQVRFKSLALGFGAGSIVNLYATYREYKHEEEKLRAFFAPEIATRLGKKPEKITIDDLYTAAKDNPTIAEAIKRNKKTGWLNFGINTVALLTAVATTGVLLKWLVPIMTHGLAVAGLGAVTAMTLPVVGSVATLLAGMAIGLGIFLAVEKPLEIVGKKLFGLTEPTLSAAMKKPHLQCKLSLPSQIQYIQHLQTRKAPISHDHVMTAFVAADPGLDAHIAANYGDAFAALSPATRAQVIKELGPNYNIETIAKDLGSHAMRAQELAFCIHGQESGAHKPQAAPRAEAPQAVAEDAAPTFTYRKLIIDERQKAQQLTTTIT